MMYLTKPEALQGLLDLEILVSKKLYKKINLITIF